MLTKTGNLLGLENPQQSQLNLGVIQSLAGEILNTDNCTVLENQHGISLRVFPSLQVSMQYVEFKASSDVYVQFPQPFKNDGYVSSVLVRSSSESTGFSLVRAATPSGTGLGFYGRVVGGTVRVTTTPAVLTIGLY